MLQEEIQQERAIRRALQAALEAAGLSEEVERLMEGQGTRGSGDSIDVRWDLAEIAAARRSIKTGVHESLEEECSTLLQDVERFKQQAT